jgi:hypothetical protein
MKYVLVNMKYVLVKYKGMNLLIHGELQMQPLIDHLADIEVLEGKVTDFYKNIMDKSSGAAAELADEQRALISKIGYKIIGVPFTNHDAELYALNKKIDYDILELHGNSGKANAAKDNGKDAQVQFRTHSRFKSSWVKAAAAYKKEHGLKKFGLTDWIEMKLNGEL